MFAGGEKCSRARRERARRATERVLARSFSPGRQGGKILLPPRKEESSRNKMLVSTLMRRHSICANFERLATVTEPTR